ncbi:DUF2147 domain-containing protein [Tenacibaculum aquimarinum]|uniref:DUF2147 domain-containing protein n=1 Tax=Tenacibaculum aquimarinum TaxID=2910675 RepID=UPI001F0A2FE2|nr:DUF2147 domain-containing protein [Tenacibaculum aquimarinum]MCH3882678.1 DUF2147 domain-containing protein [Tenacibaculum aquimarinum]
MKYLYILFLISLTTNGQTIIGKWETFDDKTKEKKAVIEIYKTDHTYSAKIIESFTVDKNALCKACKGTKKGKPIIGLHIIENIKKDGNEFNGGTILDPENGKTYKCYLQLVSNNKLKVRGFLGVALFGRTQYWIRKE